MRPGGRGAGVLHEREVSDETRGPPPEPHDRPAADGAHHPSHAGVRVRTLTLRHELARKALHLLSTAVPLAYAADVPRRTLLAALVALLLVALLVELARRRHALVRRAFHRATSPLLRAHEHDQWAGATWMLLAYVLVVWLAPRAAAIAATWAVAVGDASAAVVGRAIGRWRIGAHGKSIEGSLACCIATTLGATFVAGLGPAASLAAGVAAAVAEWPGRPLDDNVRVAAAVALTVTAMGAWLAGA